MKERPIIFSVTTGQPSQRGKRLKAADGLFGKLMNGGVCPHQQMEAACA